MSQNLFLSGRMAKSFLPSCKLPPQPSARAGPLAALATSPLIKLRQLGIYRPELLQGARRVGGQFRSRAGVRLNLAFGGSAAEHNAFRPPRPQFHAHLP